MSDSRKRDETNLPVDAVLEGEILGACFTADTSRLANVRAVLDVSEFAIEDHRRIFRSMCRIADTGGSITYAAVYSDMTARGEPITISGLMELEHGGAWALDKNLVRAKDLARRRGLILRIHVTMHQAADLSLPVDDLISSAARSIQEIYGESESSADDVLAIVEQAGGVAKFLEPRRGLPSPWLRLDYVTGGWQAGELVLIAARPSMGKTALAVNALYHAANRGIPAVFYSYEMSRESLVLRLISYLTGIPYIDLQRGELNASERRAVTEAIAHLSEIPMRIVRASGKTVLAIRCHAEKLAHKGQCQLIAVDYIGLIRGSDGAESRNRQLGDICRQLKEIASQLNIPALVLAQLNRGTETRTDKRPMMSDLRDSGELEEHADLIALLHRPGYYNREDPSLRLIAELIIGKQRNGDTPIIPLIFRRECGRFESETKEMEQCT